MWRYPHAGVMTSARSKNNVTIRATCVGMDARPAWSGAGDTIRPVRIRAGRIGASYWKPRKPWRIRATLLARLIGAQRWVQHPLKTSVPIHASYRGPGRGPTGKCPTHWDPLWGTCNNCRFMKLRALLRDGGHYSVCYQGVPNSFCRDGGCTSLCGNLVWQLRWLGNLG